MLLNFMKNEALDLLEADIPNNLEFYNSDNIWIDDYFESKGMGKYYFNSGITVPDFDLIIGDPKTDYENAIRIYEALKDHISPVQASDLRLWAFLSHSVFWDYMRSRWAIDKASEDDDDGAEANKLMNRVGARYFFKASRGKAFVRQGIARLYWSAFLTYDEGNPSNPYELTEFFLSKQDIFSVSTERSLARNKTVLLAALKVLKQHDELNRDQIRQFFLGLNQAGGITLLDALSYDDAYKLSQQVLEESLNVDSSQIIGDEQDSLDNQTDISLDVE